MAEKRDIAAIFDFDGTLFKGRFSQGLVKYYKVKHKVKLLSVSSNLVAYIPLWLASKVNILDEETHRVRWAEDLATCFRGMEKDEVLGIFDWITNNYAMKLLRPDIMALLHQHRSKGHVTLLLSNSFSDFLETINQRLGVDYVLGTKLEVIKNIYSGRIIKPLCFGVNKARLLKMFISQAQENIDLGLSFAYADSISDATILEMVGKPIATYPDKKLLNLAQRRGWLVIPPPMTSHTKFVDS